MPHDAHELSLSEVSVGLRELAFNEHTLHALQQKFSDVRPLLDANVVGRVSRLDRGWSTILMSAAGEQVRTRNIGADVAVGDWVVLSEDFERVEVVVARQSSLTRRVSSDVVRAESHTVAANMDTVLVVQAADVEPNLRRIERELVLGFDSGATPVVVFNKCDELSEADIAKMMHNVQPVIAGVDAYAVSAKTGFGLDHLRSYTYKYESETPQTIAMLGASGVGKSTLINSLVGHEVQRTGEVREGDSRGRHTTTASELVQLANGGWLLDTPGLRVVSLWMSSNGIERAFADVFEASNNCKFRDCKHGNEPSCGVHAAVASGEFAADRVANMKTLVAEEVTLENQQIVYARTQDKRGVRKPTTNSFSLQTSAQQLRHHQVCR
jgi:ribosome biogenesis GTPase